MKPNKLAVFAAAGEMSLLAIRKALADKQGLIIVGFKYISEFNKLKEFKNVRVYESPIGHFKGILQILKKESVDSILLTGKIEKVSLFKILKLDLTALKIFLKLKNFSDASLLQAVVDYFEKNNISFLSQKEFFSDLLMKEGYITKKKAGRKDMENLKWGFNIARQAADMDIGQSVITGNKVVISIEGIEGTNNMITRSKPYLLKNKYFIKAVKKNNNPVFDLPGFGLETLKLLKESGIKYIGLEKGAVLIPHMEKTIEYADKNKMIIYGI